MAKSKTVLLFASLDPAAIPPTVADVAEYCQQRGNKIDPETFCDFYQSKGWVVGRARMKDWQAAVRTWEKRDKGKPTIYDGIAAFAQREEAS